MAPAAARLSQRKARGLGCTKGGCNPTLCALNTGRGTHCDGRARRLCPKHDNPPCQAPASVAERGQAPSWPCQAPRARAPHAAWRRRMPGSMQVGGPMQRPRAAWLWRTCHPRYRLRRRTRRRATLRPARCSRWVSAAGAGPPLQKVGCTARSRAPARWRYASLGTRPHSAGALPLTTDPSCRPRGLRARPATGARARRWRSAAPASRRPPPKPPGRPRRAARASPVSSCQAPPPTATSLKSRRASDQLTPPHTPCACSSPRVCIWRVAERCRRPYRCGSVAHVRAGRRAAGAGAGARDLGPALDIDGVCHQRHAADQARRAARRQAAAAARALLRQLRPRSSRAKSGPCCTTWLVTSHSRLVQPAHSGGWCDQHTPQAQAAAWAPLARRGVAWPHSAARPAPQPWASRRCQRSTRHGMVPSLGCTGQRLALACRSLQARTFRRASPVRPPLSHAAPRRGSPPLPLPRSRLPPAALARRDAPGGDRAVSPRGSGSADAASGLLLRVEDGAGLDASWMGKARGPTGPCARHPVSPQ